jgi:hypothetical protein
MQHAGGAHRVQQIRPTEHVKMVGSALDASEHFLFHDLVGSLDAESLDKSTVFLVELRDLAIPGPSDDRLLGSDQPMRDEETEPGHGAGKNARREPRSWRLPLLGDQFISPGGGQPIPASDSSDDPEETEGRRKADREDGIELTSWHAPPLRLDRREIAVEPARRQASPFGDVAIVAI